MAIKMDPPIHQPPSARESHLQVEVEVVLVTRARRQSRYRSTESAGRRRRRQGVRGPPKREGNPWGRALMVQGRAATQPHGRRALCTPGTRAASAARARPAAGSPSKPPSVDSSHAAERGLARAPGTRGRNRRGRAQCGSGDGGQHGVVLFDDPGRDVRLLGWTVFHLPSRVDGK